MLSLQLCLSQKRAMLRQQAYFLNKRFLLQVVPEKQISKPPQRTSDRYMIARGNSAKTENTQLLITSIVMDIYNILYILWR